MTQEDRKLLLTDLYARLPYRLKFKAEDEEYIREIHYIKDEDVYVREYRNLPYWIDTIKPYLRPMSSMTEKEHSDYEYYCKMLSTNPYGGFNERLINYLNSHYLDFRGLIIMGLAIIAPEGMYNIK